MVAKTLETCNSCEYQPMDKKNAMGYCLECFDKANGIEYRNDSVCGFCHDKGRTYFIDVMRVSEKQACLQCVTRLLGA